MIALMCVDPELDPARVAIEMCISVRHLHRCLAGAGTSFGRELKAGRMAAAKAMLLSAEAPKRSEEHTYELQSLMRISYAVFCLKKKNKLLYINYNTKA